MRGEYNDPRCDGAACVWKLDCVFHALMRGTAALVLCLLLTTGAASAKVTHAVAVHGTASSCPSPEAFAAALRAIFPDVLIGSDAGLRVELSDAGPAWHITAGAAERTFTDGEARCDERARNAAVFVALVLEPPQISLPTVPEVHATHVPSRDRLLMVQLEVGGLFETALKTANGLYSGGAQLRLFVGSRYVGAVVAVAGLSPTELELRGTRVRLTRVPFDIGLRGRYRLHKVDLALDGTLVMGLQNTKGLDPGLGVEENRLEIGFRVVAKVEYWALRRVAPFIALQTEVVPKPYDLVVPGLGVAGTTPQYWLGAVAGVALALH
jgi:hypothetical protein